MLVLTGPTMLSCVHHGSMMQDDRQFVDWEHGDLRGRLQSFQAACSISPSGQLQPRVPSRPRVGRGSRGSVGDQALRASLQSKRRTKLCHAHTELFKAGRGPLQAMEAASSICRVDGHGGTVSHANLRVFAFAIMICFSGYLRSSELLTLQPTDV